MTDVTVLVPVYNEGIALAGNLAATYECLQKYDRTYNFDYIIIDDGSSDNSYAAARLFARSHENVQLVHFEKNSGLGAALRTGFERAGGQYIVTLDADLSYRPDVVITLLEALDSEGADVAMASPYMAGGSVANVPWFRKILSREANRFLSLATSGRYSTLTCMVRAYRKSALAGLRIDADGMEVSPELAFAAIRSGARVVEIPARLEWSAGRAAGSSRLNWARLGRHIAGVLQCGFRFRPTLYLAIPGLFPGLLPIVIATLLMMHASRQALAIGTAVTVAVQYVSLAIFAGQAASFFGVTFFARRRSSVRRSNLEETYRALHT